MEKRIAIHARMLIFNRLPMASDVLEKFATFSFLRFPLPLNPRSDPLPPLLSASKRSFSGTNHFASPALEAPKVSTEISVSTVPRLRRFSMRRQTGVAIDVANPVLETKEEAKRADIILF
jgi:hypothetical protein